MGLDHLPDGAYQPLGWMLFSTEYRAWGLDARGYHAVSLVWHAAVVVALYATTLHLLGHPGVALPRGRGLEFWAGLAVAGYAVHPLRVEAVAWVSCQPYLPCAFFAVLAVLAYLCERRGPGAEVRVADMFWLCYAVSLLFKAPSVSVPAVFLILDVYPLRRLGGGPGRWFGPSVEPVWREKTWFVGLGLVFSAPRVPGQSVDVPGGRRGAPTCCHGWRPRATRPGSTSPGRSHRTTSRPGTSRPVL